MIDYDATLQKFFQEILLFLNKRMERAKDKHDVICIMNTADIVRAVAKNPGKYADYNMRVADKLVEDARAFMPNSSDNSAFMIYQRVLNSMGKLNSPYEWERTEAQKVLLDMLKQIILFGFLVKQKKQVQLHLKRMKKLVQKVFV